MAQAMEREAVGTTGHVSIERQGAIALVRFDRGDGINALSRALMADLIAAADRFRDDTGVQAVVIAGGGGTFTAGADMKDPARAGMDRLSPVELRQWMRTGPDLCRAYERLEQVTICAIERFAIGGGVALAAACDWRIAGAGAFLSLPEVPRGMNLSWNTNPRLVGLIGPARTKRFVILGERIGAAEAERWGLLDAVVPDGEAEAEALAWAARVAALPAMAVRMTKEAIDATAKALAHTTSFMDRDQLALAALTGQLDTRVGRQKTD
ncbi:enoyl-CoA hydratase/isomerase family protein [Zavarzinia sp. CC-PAN008]|uniref:enoyl-CoA hydratase/isomerase family protein n=1 Tax=Zavarzinia sp. CC-PAN008 TaxID=3243332 RepID=UPI003F742661